MERGTYKQICSTGVWVETHLGTIAANSIITLDSLNDIYITDPETQQSRLINNDKYPNTRFLLGTSNEIYTLDLDGSIYLTKVSDGLWERVGAFAAYSQTWMCVICSENLITIEQNGTAYIIYSNGDYKLINDINYSHSTYVLSGSTCFYTIENNNLYATSLEDGKCTQIGETGAYANVNMAVGLNDKIYTLETDGKIYETDGMTGVYSAISNETFLDTRLIFA
jgi:hypothetical protein